MEMRMNYQKELDNIINKLEVDHRRPKLLLHSCCAPCSSYILEYLSEFFDITIFYYNPNIHPEDEYIRRVKEQQDLIKAMPQHSEVHFIQGEYRPQDYYDSIKGLEEEEEGGKRCFICYELRLREAAKIAAAQGFEFFTTTLSISPYKNAEKLNEIGSGLAQEFGVAFLPSDFKKKNGYQRSIELSRIYNLYRQNYCGCVFSLRNRQMYDENHG
jgi:predicted adenine nucleotide alpha hydrolase (AANH) superfamily ATPase